MTGKQTRRRFLKTSSAGVLGTAVGAIAAPAIVLGQTRTLTISTWGGDTENAIKSFVMPEFEKEHDCKLVFDIGSMGARYNKIRAQEGLSTVDVFFSTDEPVFNGMRTDLFAEVNPANIPNMADLHDWATPTDGFGVGYGLITFGLAYHTGIVQNPPTSWADLWREDISSNLALPAVFHSLMPALLIRTSEIAGGGADNLAPGLAKLAELRPKKLSYFWTAWAPLLETGGRSRRRRVRLLHRGHEGQGLLGGVEQSNGPGVRDVPAPQHSRRVAEQGSCRGVPQRDAGTRACRRRLPTRRTRVRPTGRSSSRPRSPAVRPTATGSRTSGSSAAATSTRSAWPSARC